jgi:radical SAM superfamily enzyme YgiQ (UPF0313 family)
VRVADLSVDRFDAAWLEGLSLVAIHLPMHTATRLALPVIAALRRRQPDLPICAYGLYAPLNEAQLTAAGVAVVLGPEAEPDLVTVAQQARDGQPLVAPDHAAVPRIAFRVPDRTGLPPLARYARLQRPDGVQAVVGATEATRGCKHRCRHCPIVPIYDGRFRVVPVEVVLADIRAQVAAGAEHITFGDPDFLNGPAHARRLVEALHAEWPSLTYDVIAKIEHLGQHDGLLPVLRDTGCAFVTTAVESLDDAVLARLDKGHTRADVEAVVARCRRLGLALAPTFIAFTPWTTPQSFAAFLDDLEALDLVEHVAPVQLTLRLLVTWNSRLLELPEVRALVGPFNPTSLTYPWAHPQPVVDDLQRRLTALVGVRAAAPRAEVFAQVRRLADEAAGRAARPEPPRLARTAIPYLTEPWYC